jgi:hypothetical protein
LISLFFLFCVFAFFAALFSEKPLKSSFDWTKGKKTLKIAKIKKYLVCLNIYNFPSFYIHLQRNHNLVSLIKPKILGNRFPAVTVGCCNYSRPSDLWLTVEIVLFYKIVY